MDRKFSWKKCIAAIRSIRKGLSLVFSEPICYDDNNEPYSFLKDVLIRPASFIVYENREMKNK